MTLTRQRICLILSALVVLLQAQPKDWQAKIDSNDWLYSPTQESGVHSPAVGNGYMATVVFSDSIFLAGVYNGNMTSQDHPSHRARVPSTVNITVKSIDSLVPDWVDCVLDLESARYFQRYNGVIEQVVYVHRSRPYLLVHELKSIKGTHKVCINSIPGEASEDLNFTATVKKDVYKVYEGWTYLTEWPSAPKRKVVVATWEPPMASPNKTGEFSPWEHCATLTETEKPLVFYTVITHEPAVDTEKLYLDVVNAKYEDLVKEHLAAWKELRRAGASIHVGGYTELAQAVNSSVYELLISMREDVPWSNSPGGLETNSYNGHMFWDFETWMYPALLVMYPELARNGLKYRLDHINGARKKAKENGYKGAMWPWESAYTGDETTPTSAATGQMEHHISGDIIFAARQYDYLHRDKKLRESMWCPLATETAEFWASRVEKDAKGYYHILHVIPPDEYIENISDSIYTNDVARIALLYGADCDPNQTAWVDIANKIYVEYDAVRDWHPEYVGYKIGQVVKQADTTLVTFPLERPYNKSTLRNDLAYYEKVTDREGPAMTWSMFFIDSIELARNEQEINQATFKYFYKSFLMNLKGPFSVWSESPDYGAWHFATGAGGFLQGLIYGYAGMRIHLDKNNSKILARLKPLSPLEPVERLEVRGINLLGGKVRIDVKLEQGDTYVRTMQDGIYLDSKVMGKYELVPGSWVKVPSNIGIKDFDGYYVISSGHFLKASSIALLLILAILLI
ncbi:MAG: hypothetical protein P4M11_13635 [Candidatus Pacebacteria bacterium]|nr:hypothetical protein [Candidatus Paceibacterota bacterium]